MKISLITENLQGNPRIFFPNASDVGMFHPDCLPDIKGLCVLSLFFVEKGNYQPTAG